VSASSQSNTPKQAASTKPTADFLAAAKAALDAGTDPGLVSTYLGHAAGSATAGTLRLLASLLTDEVKRARNGGQR
jgi:hypothetical protein